MVRGRILIRPLQNIEAVFVEEMKQNIFLGTLKDTEEDEAFTVYSEYINCLLEGSYWESGSTHKRKVSEVEASAILLCKFGDRINSVPSKLSYMLSGCAEI
ncbi:MAG: hypothetical protein OXE42_00825 [Gammaproteobacteria bacterium]|nr:hypothetical protein [Gammaproteobacteria bacterium]